MNDHLPIMLKLQLNCETRKQNEKSLLTLVNTNTNTRICLILEKCQHITEAHDNCIVLYEQLTTDLELFHKLFKRKVHTFPDYATNTNHGSARNANNLTMMFWKLTNYTGNSNYLNISYVVI